MAACVGVLLVSGCRSVRYVPVEVSDSVRVETRYVRWTERDTVYIEIPAQTAERTTRDSVSHLENDYAVSDARINADGTLYHDLKTKAQTRPVETARQVERRDSIVYRDREVEVPVYIERELSEWQKIKMDAGFIAIVALLFSAFLFLRKLPHSS